MLNNRSSNVIWLYAGFSHCVWKVAKNSGILSSLQIVAISSLHLVSIVICFLPSFE